MAVDSQESRKRDRLNLFKRKPLDASSNVTTPTSHSSTNISTPSNSSTSTLSTSHQRKQSSPNSAAFKANRDPSSIPSTSYQEVRPSPSSGRLTPSGQAPSIPSASHHGSRPSPSSGRLTPSGLTSSGQAPSIPSASHHGLRPDASGGRLAAATQPSRVPSNSHQRPPSVPSSAPLATNGHSSTIPSTSQQTPQPTSSRAPLAADGRSSLNSSRSQQGTLTSSRSQQGRRPATDSASSTVTGHSSVSSTSNQGIRLNAISGHSSANEQCSRMLEAALKKLSDTERATIKKFLPSQNPRDLTTHINQVFDAAQKQQKKCEKEKWRCNLTGKRPIVFSDEAAKVVRLVDRFKPVGDLVANTQPVLIGLPWAGIRIILEMAVTEDKTMLELLGGMELVLGASDRLQGLVDLLLTMESTSASRYLETALVNMHSLILRFLAQAIKLYGSHQLARMFATPTLLEFKNEFFQMDQTITSTMISCGMQSSAEHRARTDRWHLDMKNSMRLLELLPEMQKSLHDLRYRADNAVLARLQPASQAIYESEADPHSGYCLEGTRVDLLSRIRAWGNEPRGKSVLWLCGKAGIGKSTVSRTIARELDKMHCLGASFFFKCGEGDRGSALRFFPTVAAQLLELLPELSQPIAEALDDCPLIHEKSLSRQFEALIQGPLLKLPSKSARARRIFLVIDALDECRDQGQVQNLMSLLIKLQTIRTIEVLTFVTSRPDVSAIAGFGRLPTARHDIIFETVQESTVAGDIEIYLRKRFPEVRDAPRRTYCDVPPHTWPREKELLQLVRIATPLFIVASTICRFLSDGDPVKRLNEILKQSGKGFVSHLQVIYAPILLHCGSNKAELRKALDRVIGPIVALAEPLSGNSLSSLLQMEVSEIGLTIDPLHSVLSIPKDPSLPIQLFHQSFRDFLMDPQGQKQHGLGIHAATTHASLMRKCLSLLCRPGTLKPDICGVNDPGFRRSQLSTSKVSRYIPAHTAYACVHWTGHLSQSQERIEDDGVVHKFLSTHLLHWMEALSWLGKLSTMIHSHEILQSAVHAQKGPKLRHLLLDARRFILSCRYSVDLAPLQLYSSALLFAPQQSIVRQTFEHRTMQSLRKVTGRRSAWGPEILKLDGNIEPPYFAKFTKDGRLLAMCLRNPPSIGLWDALTGEKMGEFLGHTSVSSCLAFSECGQMMASGSDDHAVRLWDVATRKERRVSRMTNPYSLCFSPDGTLLAVSCFYGTVSLLDVTTGQQVKQLNAFRGLEWVPRMGYQQPFWTPDVEFSADGQLLLALSWQQCKYCVWDLSTKSFTYNEGELPAEDVVRFRYSRKGGGDPQIDIDLVADTYFESLEYVSTAFGRREPQPGVTLLVTPITTFLSASALKSVGSEDGRIGTPLALSSDCRTLAVITDDNGVALWDPAVARPSGEDKYHLERSLAVQQLLSHDGAILAFKSRNYDVRLFDTKSCKLITNLGRSFEREYGVGRALRIEEFSPDDTVLSCELIGEKGPFLNVFFHLRTGQVTTCWLQSGALDSIRAKLSLPPYWNILGSRNANVSSLTGTFQQNGNFQQKGEWLCHQGRDVLWLPHHCRSALLLHESQISYPLDSGELAFLKFAVPVERTFRNFSMVR